ncbi:MAG TPA: citrate lyase holo-[acyl-carrier protein] synthase [Patescibacteria group bacterium]|nr:citrate lyase holo-[acyl-carrier protein] synthase [Patescibacteria group bacterium]
MSNKSYSLLTLEDVLAAKEARQARQCLFRQRYEKTLVSLTINMPGPVKDGALVRRLAAQAATDVNRCLTVVAEERAYLPTGPEILLAVEQDGPATKTVAMELEEAVPFARLLDLDVFDREGRQLSRRDLPGSGERGCLVCGGPALICMRERRHTAAAVVVAAESLLDRFAAASTRQLSAVAETVGALAVEAMLFEVTSTPAPGLVDRVNAGAHHDMDFYTFMSSSAALSPALARCAQAGLNHQGPLERLLPVLRIIGGEGDAAMLQATAGINTQKGLLFSLGIVAAAAGWCAARQEKTDDKRLLAVTAAIVQGIVARELKPSLERHAGLTAGERLYREYGVTGIRGEMESGLPAVREQGLPVLRKALAAGLPVNDALVQTLLALMTCVEDTTVMNRHQPETMRGWVREQARQALALGGMYTEPGRAFVLAMDRAFIDAWVSPGGTADMLAVTWFVQRLTGWFDGNAEKVT